MDTLNKVDANLDNLDKIGASYLHQLDMDYKPLTSPYTWDLVDYEEESKLNIGDIVSICPTLSALSPTLKGQYKVISFNTISGKYGIVPVSSPFELPLYFTRENLILVPPANKEESFLYKKGNLVLFRYKDLKGLNKILTGQILSRFTINKSMTEPYPVSEKYYQIKDINSCYLEYVVKESDIIERLCTSTFESEQQKAVNMETSTEEPKIRIGDIVQFKLIGSDEIRIGQIEEGPSASINCFIIKDLRDKCCYLVEGSNIIKKITYYTVPDCKSNKAELTISTAESLSAAKSLEDIGKIIDSINEEKPLNIKIAKKQIKLNFKN